MYRRRNARGFFRDVLRMFGFKRRVLCNHTFFPSRVHAVSFPRFAFPPGSSPSSLYLPVPLFLFRYFFTPSFAAFSPLFPRTFFEKTPFFFLHLGFLTDSGIQKWCPEKWCPEKKDMGPVEFIGAAAKGAAKFAKTHTATKAAVV